MESSEKETSLKADVKAAETADKATETAVGTAVKTNAGKSAKGLKLTVAGMVLLGLQLITSVFFAFHLNKLNMLDGGRFLGIMAILVLLLGVAVAMQLSKGGKVVGYVYSALIILATAVLGFYLFRTNKALDSMVKTDTETTTVQSSYTVLVTTESGITGLNELDGQTVAVQSNFDAEDIENTLKELEEKYSITFERVAYDSYPQAGEALVAGEVKAMVLNEIYRGMLEDDIDDFTTLTHEVDSIVVEKKVEKTAKEEEETSKEEVMVQQEPFTIFLSGNDDYGQVSVEWGRSDVNILVTVNPNTKEVLLTSTPRDYYLEMPFSAGSYDKLTHMSIFGIENSEKVLSDLYETEIDYYVRINFSGFQNVVDALGGVSVYSDYSFTAFDGTSFTEGYNECDGYKALTFVRERHAFSDGDFQRGRNQMHMIQAIVDKVTSPAILTSYLDLLETLDDCFLTDMPVSKMTELVQMQLSDNAEWHITSQAATGSGNMRSTYTSGGDPRSVVDPNMDSVAACIENIRKVENGEILPDE